MQRLARVKLPFLMLCALALPLVLNTPAQAAPPCPESCDQEDCDALDRATYEAMRAKAEAIACAAPNLQGIDETFDTGDQITRILEIAQGLGDPLNLIGQLGQQALQQAMEQACSGSIPGIGGTIQSKVCGRAQDYINPLMQQLGVMGGGDCGNVLPINIGR